MKKKPNPAAEKLVAKEILDRAKKSLQSDKLQRPLNCVVCGSPCAPTSAEGLCWVCRRLKISAWHESDQQMPAQE